jgi:hypothetical protein
MHPNRLPKADCDRLAIGLRDRCGDECILYDHGGVERARLKSCVWDADSITLEFEPLPTPGLLSHDKTFSITGSWDIVSISNDLVSLLWVGIHVYFEENLVRRMVELAATIRASAPLGERVMMMAQKFNEALRYSLQTRSDGQRE